MQIKSNKFLRWSSFLLLCSIAFSLTGTLSSQEEPTNKTSDTKLCKHNVSSDKARRWQEMEKEVNSWTDGLGLGIDPGIKKMIIVLNLLNFKTKQSCEGHVDRGHPYPWVRITFEESSELSSLRKQRIKNSNVIEEQHAEIQKKHPELSLGEATRKEDSKELYEAYKKKHSLGAKIEKISKLRIIKLNNLITDFYKKHSVDPDRILVIAPLWCDAYELHSLGGDWQIVRDDNEKLRKLKEYQEEMNLFADFLTDCYLKSI